MLHTLHFFSFGLFFELPQMNASLFCLSFPFLQKAERTNLKVVTFRVFSEIIGNCVPFSFALPIWIENEVFIFTKDLLLFYPFVTKVTNSEDLEVIVNWSKFALVCCMCYGLRARDHGQSASKLLKQLQPWGLCTSSCFFSAHSCDFTLDSCARLCALHSANCNTISHKNSEDSTLPHFNCKSNC